MKMEQKMTVTTIINKVIEQMCDEYCRFPREPIPEGKGEDWLTEDADSPCNTCPLNWLG